MPIELFNKRTGKVILTEDDSGKMTIYDDEYREAYEKAMVTETGEKPDVAPKSDDVSRQKLIEAHDNLHTKYEKNKWDSIEQTHQKIVDAMQGLGIEHKTKDDLDETLES